MKKMSRLMAFAIVTLSSGPVLQAETWKEQAEEMYRQRGRYGRETVDFLGRHKGKIAAGVGTAALVAAAYYAAPGIKERMRLQAIVKERYPSASHYEVSFVENLINGYNKGRSIEDLAHKHRLNSSRLEQTFKQFINTGAFTEEAKVRLADDLKAATSR